jgi:hypothetical protein
MSVAKQHFAEMIERGNKFYYWYYEVQLVKVNDDDSITLGPFSFGVASTRTPDFDDTGNQIAAAMNTEDFKGVLANYRELTEQEHHERTVQEILHTIRSAYLNSLQEETVDEQT